MKQILNGVAHQRKKRQTRRTWYGKKVPRTDTVSSYDLDLEQSGVSKRPTVLYAPIYNGLAAGMAMVFIGNGLSASLNLYWINFFPLTNATAETLLTETMLDGSYIRFALCSLLPLLFCVSLVCSFPDIQSLLIVTFCVGLQFFSLQIVQNISYS